MWWARYGGQRARNIAGSTAACAVAAALCAGTRTQPECAASEGSGNDHSILTQITCPPPFSLNGERFDMSTYPGRACHFLNVLGDLSTLFLTRKRVDDHLALLQKFESEGRTPGVSDADLWRARKVREAVIHPETGDMILAPFRFSALWPSPDLNPHYSFVFSVHLP